MWRAVVQQDNRGGKGEGTRGDLQEEHDDNGKPDPDAIGLVRGRRGGRGECDIRSKGICQGKEREEVLITFGRSQTAVDRRVDGELKKHPNHTQDRRCKTNTLGQHSETTSENKWQLLRQTSGIVEVITRGGEEK